MSYSLLFNKRLVHLYLAKVHFDTCWFLTYMFIRLLNQITKIVMSGYETEHEDHRPFQKMINNC